MERAFDRAEYDNIVNTAIKAICERTILITRDVLHTDNPDKKYPPTSTIRDCILDSTKKYIIEHNMEGPGYNGIRDILHSIDTEETIRCACYIHDMITENNRNLKRMYELQGELIKGIDDIEIHVYDGTSYDDGVLVRSILSVMKDIHRFRKSAMTMRYGLLDALDNIQGCILAAKILGTDKGYIRGQGLLIMQSYDSNIEFFNSMMSTLRECMQFYVDIHCDDDEDGDEED